MRGLVLSPRTGFGRVPAWRFILVAAVAAAVALAAFSAPSPAQEKKPQTPSQPPAQVGVDAVITEPLRQTVPVIGRFVARQTGVAAARVSGPVGEIRVEVGDRVLFDPQERAEVEVRGESFVLLRERDLHAVASERIEEGQTGLYL